MQARLHASQTMLQGGMNKKKKNTLKKHSKLIDMKKSLAILYELDTYFLKWI